MDVEKLLTICGAAFLLALVALGNESCNRQQAFRLKCLEKGGIFADGSSGGQCFPFTGVAK